MEVHMADRVDHAPEGAYNSVSLLPGNEAQYQIDWHRDIERASRKAANGNRDDADDLAQEARLRVMKTFRAKPDAPVPYIRTVISNAVKTARRQQVAGFTSKSAFAAEADENTPAPLPDNAEEQDRQVSAWITTLPEPMHNVYRHLYSENLSQRETARLLNLSQPRVSQLHNLILERGRQELTRLAA